MWRIFKKNPFTPQDLAHQAQRILSGQCRRWDVDDYENYDPKDPKLKDLHLRTLGFGLPETWFKLDDAQKSRLRAIIEQMENVEGDS
jgi:hypothetical protein